VIQHDTTIQTECRWLTLSLC